MSTSVHILDGPEQYQLFLDCVHCGLCLDACPTYTDLGTEMDSPRGRIHLMRAVADGRLPVTGDVTRHLDLCLGCRACETACPSGVRYGAMIDGARAIVERCRRPSVRGWLQRRVLIGGILPHPRRLGLALLPVRLLDAISPRRAWTRLLPPRLARLVRMLPRRRRRPGRVGVVTPARGPERGAVGLLRGCVTSALYPDLVGATVRVLGRLGYTVFAPRGGCCGALHLHVGDRRGALRHARRTVRAFRRHAGAPVVVAAAGCGAVMRTYGELLASDPKLAAAAAELARRVVDVSEIVDAGLEAAGGAVPLGALPHRATYHDACHLAHAQGVRVEPRRLLRRIPELELVPLAGAECCCGSAGTYNITEPEMADHLQRRQVEAVLGTGAEWVVTGNPGCMLQIAAGLAGRGSGVQVLHTVELIDRAMHEGDRAHRRRPGDP